MTASSADPGAEHGYGVLLPHFGGPASAARIIGGGRLAEAQGFDSVWARDHVLYRPHGHEDQDPTFVDPFVALSAVAATTERIALGFAVLVPHRHPIHAAACLASLDFMAGPSRVIVGMGLTSDKNELSAVGMGKWDRRVVFAEYVQIMRRLWSGEEVTFAGQYYQVEAVKIKPIPAGAHLPIWYGAGASSDASVRRGVEFCDGMFVSTRRAEFVRRSALIKELAGQLGRPLPRLAANITVVPLGPREQLTDIVDLEALSTARTAGAARPLSGRNWRESLEAFDGSVIAGSPHDLAEGVRKWNEAGCTHFVFNLRYRHDEFEKWVRLIGEEVLPALRR